MTEQATTLIVFFNLKDGVNESDYLHWAQNIDLPTVNALNSVASFDVYKGLSILGQDTPSPYQYFEVINLKSEAAFLDDIQSEVMTKVIEQFQAFTKDASFTSTQNIAAR